MSVQDVGQTNVSSGEPKTLNKKKPMDKLEMKPGFCAQGSCMHNAEVHPEEALDTVSLELLSSTSTCAQSSRLLEGWPAQAKSVPPTSSYGGHVTVIHTPCHTVQHVTQTKAIPYVCTVQTQAQSLEHLASSRLLVQGGPLLNAGGHGPPPLAITNKAAVDGSSGLNPGYCSSRHKSGGFRLGEKHLPHTAL
jgi:hypothetical protein